MGKADLGFRNNHTRSPTLNKLAAEGVRMKSYYSFKVCSPARASILTGRMPYDVGFYSVGGDNQAVPQSFKLTPEVLKSHDPSIECVAIGKWHVRKELSRQ